MAVHATAINPGSRPSFGQQLDDARPPAAQLYRTELWTDVKPGSLRATALEGFTSVVHPTVAQVTGRPAGTFRAWAERNRASFA